MYTLNNLFSDLERQVAFHTNNRLRISSYTSFDSIKNLFTAHQLSMPIDELKTELENRLKEPDEEKNSEKRKCVFVDFSKNESCEPRTRVGWFHKWAKGRRSAELDNQEKFLYVDPISNIEWNFGIVEDESGQVHEVLPRCITFID